MRMVVVLPAPFGPRKPKTSPLSIESEIAHGGELAVVLAEVLKRDHASVRGEIEGNPP